MYIRRVSPPLLLKSRKRLMQ